MDYKCDDELDGGYAVDGTLEPDIASARAAISQAISLKRIADNLDEIAKPFKLLNPMIEVAVEDAIATAMSQAVDSVLANARKRANVNTGGV